MGDGSGIYDGCDYDDNLDLDHLVLITGYGVENGTKFWNVRNSWSKWWGEKGYIRLLWEDKVKCGMDKTPEDGLACKGDHTP